MLIEQHDRIVHVFENQLQFLLFRRDLIQLVFQARGQMVQR